MSDQSKKYYLTTPIYYVNARPHIGHAYTTIAADVIARRQRTLLGKDNVWFLTGTDEHGQKVQRSAQAAGITPQQFTDEVSAQFRALWQRMGITYDDYIRTTEPRHVAGVQKLFNELYSRGHIYLDTYTGQYSVGEEMFVDGPPGTIGPDGKPTETVTEENFYFRLSAYQAQLIDLIESGEFCVEPEARRNEVLSFLRGNISAATDVVIPSEAASAAQPRNPRISPEAPTSSPESKLAYSTKGTPYVPGALKDLSISR
ncbi:MAG TPA: class I tRNA ligase family protein, partial [Edaphobacter sp.]